MTHILPCCLLQMLFISVVMNHYSIISSDCTTELLLLSSLSLGLAFGQLETLQLQGSWYKARNTVYSCMRKKLCSHYSLNIMRWGRQDKQAKFCPLHIFHLKVHLKVRKELLKTWHQIWSVSLVWSLVWILAPAWILNIKHTAKHMAICKTHCNAAPWVLRSQ